MYIITKVLCYSKYFRKFSSNVDMKGPLSQVFSGIQPTGGVHLGNYLGALRHWVQMQDKVSRVTFCIVDLHSITLPQKPTTLQDNIKSMTSTLLACGIDPERSTIFLQSTVPQHAQLCWQLSCIATMARLAHLPEYKTKSATLKDVPLGLFIYPILQAADILVHKATHVPVGEDQIQHLQLAQELAKMFNNRYGYTFPIPRPLLTDNRSCRVKSLRDPLKKMSKSDPDPKSRINLTDSPTVILEKIKKAVTDCTSEVTYDPDTRPGVSNLVNIHSTLTGKNQLDICTEIQADGLDTGKYKYVVAESIASTLAPIQEKFEELQSRPGYIEDVLENGRKAATVTAQQTLEEVHRKVGTIIDTVDAKETQRNLQFES